MILDKVVEIVVSNQNLDYYLSLGYNALYRKPLKINVMDLTIGSHYKVNVECDSCFDKNIVEFRQLKGINSYLCKSCAAKFRKPAPKRSIEENIRILEKTRKTKFERYGDENYQNIDKIKETKFERYGDEGYTNIYKTRRTKFVRYGNENYNNQELKRKTLLEKYGCENYNNSEKRKNTLGLLYNDPCFNNQDKKEQTCLEKYGVRHTNQIPKIMDSINKSGKLLKNHELNIKYRGSYEKHFLDYCLKNSISIDSYIGNIKYFVGNKEHRYYPDFFHRETNTIIEIKSEYTYEVNIYINLLKKEYSLFSGYNFIFIIDKDYTEFNKIVGL